MVNKIEFAPGYIVPDNNNLQRLIANPSLLEISPYFSLYTPEDGIPKLLIKTRVRKNNYVGCLRLTAYVVNDTLHIVSSHTLEHLRIKAEQPPVAIKQQAVAIPETTFIATDSKGHQFNCTTTKNGVMVTGRTTISNGCTTIKYLPSFIRTEQFNKRFTIVLPNIDSL